MILYHFPCSSLKTNWARYDYRKFLELCIIFLGGTPAHVVNFMAPGAMHHARWVAKALYTFKIWMFRGQFKLTKHEELGLCSTCIFVACVYIKACFTAPLAASAPNNDLSLLKTLVHYQKENPAICTAASSKFTGHLWYISEEFVALAFFDSAVNAKSKQDIMKALHEQPGQDDFKEGDNSSFLVHQQTLPLVQKVRKVVKIFCSSPTKNDKVLQKYVKEEFGKAIVSGFRHKNTME